MVLLTSQCESLRSGFAGHPGLCQSVRVDVYLIFYGGAALVGVVAWLLVRRAFPPYRPVATAGGLVEAEQEQLLRAMPTAMQNGEIFLAYQPKLDLRSGNIDGVEALLRWRHPTLGTAARTMLIPLLEQRGEIRELTIWVLRRALIDQRRLFDKGRSISIHINVSASLLTDDEFVREVCAIADPATSKIGLEITETVLIDDSRLAMANLKLLTDRGISISIDDYGAGMSSLAYLKDLPAKELKIDKMFISGMTTSHRDPLIVRSTIDLAHALELTVVAEGVESPATLALLRVMGCDFAQGFLISPALTIDALESFLDAGTYRQTLADAAATVIRPTAFWKRTSNEPRIAGPVLGTSTDALVTDSLATDALAPDSLATDALAIEERPTAGPTTSSKPTLAAR